MGLTSGCWSRPGPLWLAMLAEYHGIAGSWHGLRGERGDLAWDPSCLHKTHTKGLLRDPGLPLPF